MIYNLTEIYNDNSTNNKRILTEKEAYLLYNGAPDLDDDPADYFDYSLKAVRIA